MADETLRSEAVAALTAARRKVSSASAMIKLQQESEEVRAAAGEAIIEAGIAAQVLRRARLEEIADGMEAEADAIKAATKSLNKAVEDLNNIKKILDGITALVKIVGRVVALVA